jgi:hypothetical protein
MTLMEGIAALLTADAEYLAAVPGGIADTLLPEGATLPALTFQIVGGQADPTLDTSGMQRWRVQFDVRAEDAAGAVAGRENLIRVLNGFRGVPVDGAPWIEGIDLIQPIDYYDSEARQFRKGAEFYVMFCFAEDSGLSP